MKKFGIILSMALAIMLGTVSCQDSADRNKALATKIENKETLSADDYSDIINYVGEYAEKAQKYVDMQINGENQAEATEGMNKLNEEYPYLEEYRNCLKNTSVEDLSAENQELIGKYAGYIEFSAPAGYTIETAAPENAGLEEALPATENGVVAGAVDTEKVEDKGW